MCPIINDNKFIIIPSLRAYHFFDAYEKVVTLSLKSPAPPRTSIKVVSDDLLSAIESFRDGDPTLANKKNAWVSASATLAGKTEYPAAVSILTQNTKQLQDIVNLIISSKKKPSSDTISSVKKLLTECATAIVDIEWIDQYILNDNTIKGKAHVSINQKDHTILWLDLVPVGTQITKRQVDSSNIIVFDNHLNTQNPSLDFSLPFNKWAGANDNNISSWISGPVDSSQSLFSAGSYGTGSPKNIPILLSKAYVYNKLHKIHETASSRQTDIGVRSSVNMWKIEPSTPPAAPVLTKVLDNAIVNLLGYNYTFDDVAIMINSTKNIVEMISPNSANTIDQLVRFEKEAKTYSLNKDNLGLMELKIAAIGATIPDQGVIGFNCDKRSSVPTYSFTEAQETQIKNRINLINGSGTIISRETRCPSGSDKDCYNNYLASIIADNLYINDLLFYIDNIRVRTGTNWGEESVNCLLNMTSATSADCPKLVASTRLRQLLMELDQLLLAMEKYPRSSTRNPVPLVDIEVKIDPKDQSLSFVENSQNKDYWINIDPEQGCSISKSACSKVLLQTVYTCLPTAVSTTLLPPSDIFAHVCPKSVGSFAGLDVEFKNEGSRFTYTRTRKKILEDMRLYPGANWPEPLNGIDYMSAPNLYRVERIFFLNALGNEPNQPVQSSETYLLPLEDKRKTGIDSPVGRAPIFSGERPDGSLTNKVKHIFPLIDQDKLMVRFRHIPRKSKHIDPYFDRRVPDQNGNASKSIIPSPGGTVDNSLMAWQCIDRRDKTYVIPPPYYQWQNEMLFRTYFGSLDGIENIGKDMMQTKEPGEWIPYDYL